jgi:hypothetical protein
MMMGNWINDKPVMVLNESGGYNKFVQEIRIEYLDAYGHLTPKTAISISSNNPLEKTPRSFRTDNPDTLGTLIKHLIRCKYRLEDDIKAIKERR